MFIEICSNNYAVAMGKGDAAVYFESRYWVDDNNVYWYSYDDICKSVKLNESIAKRWYKYDIPEDQKCTCMDSNNYDQFGVQQPLLMNYITSETAHIVVNQHAAYVSERDKNIIKTIDNLEFAGYAYNVYEDAEELKEYKHLIYNSIDNDDYQELCLQCYNLVQTESARDVLDKMGVIDKEFEKAVDELRKIILEDNNEDAIQFTLSKENDIWNNWINQ